MALTTLAEVKEYLGSGYDGSEDALLQTLIDRLSNQVELWCDRTFDATAYTEWVDGSGDVELGLDNYPIIILNRVALQTSTCGYLYCTSAGLTQASCIVRDGTMTLIKIVAGVSTTDTLTLSTYATVTLLAAAIAALGHDWTLDVVSAYQSFPASVLKPIDGAPAIYPERVDLKVPDDDEDYPLNWDSASGIISMPRGFPAGRQNVYVDYTGGYATIPAALSGLVTQMVVEAYRDSKKDLSYQSERLGDYSYSLGSGSGDGTSSRSIVRRYADELSMWKRWVI